MIIVTTAWDERFVRKTCDRAWCNRAPLRRDHDRLLIDLFERLGPGRPPLHLTDGERVQLAEIDLELKEAGL